MTTDAGTRDAGASADSGVQDGDSFSFASTTASAGPPRVEFLGGKGGVIDTGATGARFSRANWSYLFDALSYWTFEDNRVLSRSHSLYFVGSRDGNDPRGTAFFDWGAAGFQEEYFSCNYYATIPSVPIQLKLRRWHSLPDVEDGASFDSSSHTWGPNIHGEWKVPQLYRTGRFDGSTSLIAFGDLGGAYPLINAGVYYPAANWPQGRWFRFESYVRQSSGVGVADGSYWEKVTDVATGAILGTDEFTGLTLKPTQGGTAEYRYSVLQNFFGNNADSVNSSISMDDVYLSASGERLGFARARVEVIDASTPAAANRAGVIQQFTKVGTQVTIPSLNLGPLAHTAPLYFVEYGPAGTVVTSVRLR